LGTSKNAWSTILTNTNKKGSRYAQLGGSAILIYSFSNFLSTYVEPLEKNELLRGSLSGMITGALYRSVTGNVREVAKGIFNSILLTDKILGGLAGLMLALGLVVIEMEPEKRKAIVGV